MEWLLVIAIVSAADEPRPEPIRFATESQCTIAAETFVRSHPAFELRDGSGEGAVVNPVMRSYVECVTEDAAGRARR